MTRTAATSPAPPGQAAPPTRATGRIGEPPSTAGMMATNRLSAALRQGGYVIVHRYTGTTRSDTPAALPNSIDDGQRLSAGGREAAEQIGEVYRRLEIPVYQTAEAAMARVGASVQLSCDPTGSP